MNISTILLNSASAAIFTAGMAAVFSAPSWALAPSLFCGFLARLVRDLLMGWGASQNLATLVAAALVVVSAVGFVRRRNVTAIVLLAGLIPLGAAGALFRAIVGFLQISDMKGEGLSAPIALISNLSVVFTTTNAIVVGAWIGYLMGQSVWRDRDSRAA
jgi:uncharacterized membrane protein YjjB (DUF3815 family)